MVEKRCLAIQAASFLAVMVVTLAAVVPLTAADSPATSPSSQVDDVKLRRGQEIRRILRNAMEESHKHDGEWPDKLPAEPAAIELVYKRPRERLTASHWGSGGVDFAMATVVMHEPFDRNPDGVWVGYADGHLEFATSPADLAACEAQPSILRRAVARYGDVFGPRPSSRVDPKDAAAKLSGKLALKLVDPDGRPVAGAQVGMFGQFGDLIAPSERVVFHGQPRDRSQISDANGLLAVPAARVFNPGGSGSRFLDLGVAPLYALDERRGLVAVEEAPLSEFGSGAIREIRLVPGCKVRGQITSVGLLDAGRNASDVEAFAFKPGQLQTRAVFSESARHQFELLLPPGEYGVYVSGTLCLTVYRYARIEPGQHELRLQLDLSPKGVMNLLGHPAPEFRGIREWKNGGPVTLAGMRGKVVLLDFWGEWCGPCVQSMPYLMALHDEFKDKGLVILAVHDDSVPSIAEMDRRLDERRKKYWGGRDLPFPVALDGGGSVRITGTATTARGATTAAYGINAFPTTLIVGRDGNVVQQIEAREPKEAREAIEKALRAVDGRPR